MNESRTLPIRQTRRPHGTGAPMHQFLVFYRRLEVRVNGTLGCYCSISLVIPLVYCYCLCLMFVPFAPLPHAHCPLPMFSPCSVLTHCPCLMYSVFAPCPPPLSDVHYIPLCEADTLVYMAIAYTLVPIVIPLAHCLNLPQFAHCHFRCTLSVPHAHCLFPVHTAFVQCPYIHYCLVRFQAPCYSLHPTDMWSPRESYIN